MRGLWPSPSGGIQDKEWVTSDPQKGVNVLGGLSDNGMSRRLLH